MQIAIIENNVITLAHKNEVFANSSTNANLEKIASGVMKVYPLNAFIDHNRETHKLVPCAPYLNNGQVFVMKVEKLTAEELAGMKASKDHQRIAEIKRKLAESDFRVLPDYQARSGKSDTEIKAIYAQRKDLYDEMQALEARYVAE